MTNNLLSLYQYAEARNIDTDWCFMGKAKSLSMPCPDGSCCIALDPWKMNTLSEETTSLAHELGHCETGSFYNRWAAMDVRQKHENRADKWAIRRLVPANELYAAMEGGCTDVWSLAELFGVTPEFMKKAICWYRNGNLATELYVYE